MGNMNKHITVRAVVAFLFTLTTLTAYGSDELGIKPSYLIFARSNVPNQKAVSRMIWAPGLDDGYVPQGVAISGRSVLVSAYKSTDTKAGTGPCRIYRIDQETGEYTGFFDMPADCGHTGGRALIGGDELAVADTGRLYLIGMERAFEMRSAQSAIKSAVNLAGELKGSFISFDRNDLWIGVNDKTPGKSKMYRIPLSVFDKNNDTMTITEASATDVIAVPVMAQGAAFDGRGNLWTTSSSSRFGALYRLDSVTGEILDQYRMVIGIEGISFDKEGGLWSVSEAGSRRWLWWSMTFPVLFQIDVSKLE